MAFEKTFIPFHSPALFDRAEQSSKRGEGVSSCILAVSATEAFTNDLTEWYKVAEHHKLHCPNNEEKFIFPGHRFTTCASILHTYTDLEDLILKKISYIELVVKNESLMNKFLELHALCNNGKEADKGSNPYQDFSLLIDIRNGIVHAKGERLFISHETSDISGYPRFIKDLAQKRLIVVDEKISSWLNLVENKKFAEWCLKTAKGIIESSINMLPKTKLSELFKNNTRI